MSWQMSYLRQYYQSKDGKERDYNEKTHAGTLPAAPLSFLSFFWSDKWTCSHPKRWTSHWSVTKLKYDDFFSCCFTRLLVSCSVASAGWRLVACYQKYATRYLLEVSESGWDGDSLRRRRPLCGSGKCGKRKERKTNLRWNQIRRKKE